jgi:hypothetical protein
MSARPGGATSAPLARGGEPPAMGGGSPRGSGRNVAGPSGGNWQGSGNWKGHHHGRRHHRGAFFAYGFATPYLYDSWPYYSSYYGDNGCWEVRYIRGASRRVWVCD